MKTKQILLVIVAGLIILFLYKNGRQEGYAPSPEQKKEICIKNCIMGGLAVRTPGLLSAEDVQQQVNWCQANCDKNTLSTCLTGCDTLCEYINDIGPKEGNSDQCRKWCKTSCQ